jgi:hypothetical protein
LAKERNNLFRLQSPGYDQNAAIQLMILNLAKYVAVLPLQWIIQEHDIRTFLGRKPKGIFDRTAYSNHLNALLRG